MAHLAQLITMEIFGSWSYYQLGELAGREAARKANPGARRPHPWDFDPSCDTDYIAGYEAGWAYETIPVITMASDGPRTHWEAR